MPYDLVLILNPINKLCLKTFATLNISENHTNSETNYNMNSTALAIHRKMLIMTGSDGASTKFTQEASFDSKISGNVTKSHIRASQQ